MGQRGKFSPDEFTVPIEAMILTGEHPALVGLGPIAHSVYLKLIGLCWKIGRSELTAGYLQASVLRATLGLTDQRTLDTALRRLVAAGLVSVGSELASGLQPVSSRLAAGLQSVGGSTGIPLKYRSVHVVGLEDKLPHRNWKSADKIRVDQNTCVSSPTKSAPTQPENLKNADKTKTERPSRTRRPTEAEQAFSDGFHATYGHRPTISRGHAIRLGQLVTLHGLPVVLSRIKAWWTHPAGNWVRGARNMAAFLHSFDSLADGLVYAAPSAPVESVAVDQDGRSAVTEMVRSLAGRMGGSE